MYKSLVRNESPNKVNIKWRITEWCNYRCSYCIRRNAFQGERLTKEHLELYDKRAKKIGDLCKATKENICINLIGGEISVLPLQNYLRNYWNLNNIKTICITSNFSSDNKQYKKFLDAFFESKNECFVFTFSLHDEFVKDFEAFFQKAKELQDYANKKINEHKEKKVQIYVEFVETSSNKEACDKIISLSKKYEIKLRLDPCRDNNTEKLSVEYRGKENDKSSNLIKHWILKTNEDQEEYCYVNEILTKFQTDGYGVPVSGFWCYSKGFTIDFDGNIRWYICKNFSSKYKSEKKNIDTISLEELKLSLGLVKCPGKYGCHLCGQMKAIFKDEEKNNIAKIFPEIQTMPVYKSLTN